MRRFPLRRAILRTLVLVSAAAAVFVLSDGALASETGGKVNLAQALRPSLLLFPFDVNKVGAPNAADISAELTEKVASRFFATKTYSVTQFYRSLGPIITQLNEQKLSDADVVPPFAEDNLKSTKIARLVGFDVVFVGSVDDYQYNPDNKQVTLTISGRLLEVGADPNTPFKILKSVTRSASSASGGEGKEEDRALEAARAAADQLVAQIAPFTTPPVETRPIKPTTPEKPKRRGGPNLTWLIGVVAIGIGLGIGLTRGDGGGGDSPPPPPR